MKNVKANTNFRTKQILGARLNFDSETMYLIGPWCYSMHLVVRSLLILLSTSNGLGPNLLQ